MVYDCKQVVASAREDNWLGKVGRVETSGI